MTAVLFYTFSSVLLLSAALTIFSRNPVHSVLWLILAFLNAAMLFLLLGAEFIAMVTVIVHVGAVAVLFLFVMMMLDLGRAGLKAGIASYWQIATVIAVIFLAQLLLMIGTWSGPVGPMPDHDSLAVPNIQAFGEMLFTHYLFLFEAAGLILLVALVGAVLLTARIRPRTRRQRVSEQVRRRPDEAVRNVQLPVGRGLDPLLLGENAGCSQASTPGSSGHIKATQAISSAVEPKKNTIA